MRLRGISNLRPVVGTTPRELGGGSGDIVAAGNMSFPGLDVTGTVQARIRPCPPTAAGTWMVFGAGANVQVAGTFIYGVGPIRLTSWLVVPGPVVLDLGGFVFGVTPKRDSSWIVAPSMMEEV